MGLSPSDCGETSVSSFVTADKWKTHPSILQLMVVRVVESIPAVTDSYVDSPKDFSESLWNLHVTCILRITPVLSLAAQLVEHTVHFHAELNPRSGSELCTVFLVVDLLSAHISCIHYTLPVQQCSQFGQACGCLYCMSVLNRSHTAFSSPSHPWELVLTDPGQSHYFTESPELCHSYVRQPGLPSVEQLQKGRTLYCSAKQEKEEPLETFSDTVVAGMFDRFHKALLAIRRFLTFMCK